MRTAVNSPLTTADPVGRLASALIEHSPATPTTETQLASALANALETPGKLARAQLTLQGCRAQGLAEDDALALATAVEYFHLASLVLDDLPCMDNSMTRRGRPCLHRTHGDATTILTSLALINRAYALCHDVLSRRLASVQTAARACLENALGTEGIIGGQARDLRFGSSPQPAREVLRIAARKTGALFLLSIYLPAIFGQPSANERRALHALCIYWGLGYQVIDDLNDVLATSLDTGKTSGRDQALNRPNLALATSVPAARHRLAHLLTLSTHALKKLDKNGRWSYLMVFQRSHFELLVNQKVLPGAGARSAA
jgi:geranylgeranyl pyrophosphate synthase